MRDDPPEAQPARVVRLRDDGRSERDDLLAAEEPLEVRVEGARWLVTLRTPGEDLDLVMGLLWSDGVIADVRAVDLRAREHVVDVIAAQGATLDLGGATRATTVTSACGMCGRHAIDDVCAGIDLRDDRTELTADALAAMPERLRATQGAFALTGGTHGAGLFTPDGALVVAREDVGRHNAVDKVIGAMIRRARVSGEHLARGRIALRGHALVVTGRAGFEIVQKAARAGIPVVCAVSAPTSLSVALAQRAGITLAAFARGRSMNLYAHPERVR